LITRFQAVDTQKNVVGFAVAFCYISLQQDFNIKIDVITTHPEYIKCLQKIVVVVIITVFGAQNHLLVENFETKICQKWVRYPQWISYYYSCEWHLFSAHRPYMAI
jgi:hypothetical protein